MCAVQNIQRVQNKEASRNSVILTVGGKDGDQIKNKQREIEYKAKSNHRTQAICDPKVGCVSNREFLLDAPLITNET